MTEPIARLRDGSPVGAWLLKANPAVWDVLGAIERGDAIDRWRLAWSYRVEMVRPGHPCLLWVTGPSKGRYVPGVWALGVVTGAPTPRVDDASDPDWLDPSAPRDTRPYIDVSLRVLAKPLARADLVSDPRLEGMEVIRRPRLGSPLALSPLQWQVVRELADE